MLLNPERALRAKLEIPQDAQRVLVFGESSHWDTNWLKTSEEYFTARIDPIFDAVFKALAHDPKRVFAVESVFFLKLYWERRPHQQRLMRELLTSGRLKLLSASLTTPDTLLPGTETILRDYLMGQEWLRANGLDLTPRISYFPDNFGHSPALPTLMRALGIDKVGVTRVDGMYFIGSDWRRKSKFPLAGSTAAVLQNEQKTLDFVWRGEDGAEVLCHWNAFTYFQGDMLAHAGIIRWSGKTFAVPWRSSSHIARRMKRYIKDLGPLTKTPYMFCPIGMDFNSPIEDIGALLARYNRDLYPYTGVYLVSAGLDDYLDLVACHKEKLPVLQCDPNPYWMGFYSTRPEVKQRPRRIARTLLLTEKLAAQHARDPITQTQLQKAWSILALTNHHDYITGTSPDRVWHGEQKRWLDEAEQAAKSAWERVAPLHPERPPVGQRVQYEHTGDTVAVQTDHYRFVIAPNGCFISLKDAQGRELLESFGNDLIVYRDTGGLWRLGHEFSGGSLTPIRKASETRANMSVLPKHDELIISIANDIDGMTFYRRVVCRTDSPFIRMRAEGAAKSRWTVTCAFNTVLRTHRLWMDTPGGHVTRNAHKLYDPTFWPVQSHCAITDAAPTGGARMHVSFDTPGALAFGRHGNAEWIVARNAPKERAFGFLPVLAHPIGGSNHEAQHFDYAIAVEPKGTHDDRAMTQHRRTLASQWLPPHERAAWTTAHALVHVSDPRAIVTAVKHAEDGGGHIVRLRADDRTLKDVTLGMPRLREAFICDAREVAISPLAVNDELCQVPIDTGIVTVRLYT